MSNFQAIPPTSAPGSGEGANGTPRGGSWSPHRPAPVPEPMDALPRRITTGDSDAGRIGILVVDDEPDILKSFAQLIKMRFPGVDVYTASSATRALQLLADTSVDAILSDFLMPGMDGLEFLANAGTIDGNAAHFLVTAAPDKARADKRFSRVRVDQLIAKPCDPSRILDAVSGVMQQAIEHRPKRDP